MKIPIELKQKYNKKIENIEVIGTIPIKVSVKISSEMYATDYQNDISKEIIENFKKYFYKDIENFIINETMGEEQNYFLVIHHILEYIRNNDRFEVINKEIL